MNTPVFQTATRSRWMDWKPKKESPSNLMEQQLTEPPVAGFEGFEGATSAESAKTEAQPDPAELTRASGVLNRAGVRSMVLEGGVTIGLWSDLDGPGVREALHTLGADALPLRYLDAADIPDRYKLRRVDGEPVPLSVLSEMERTVAEPWKVRDELLAAMRYTPEPVAARRIGSKRRWRRTEPHSRSIGTHEEY